MRKLIFDSISIEVTRRCNLSCRHCLRGDAQAVDIEPATIDALMEQVARIYSLSFTGGEPTLNVSAMVHTLDALRQRSIPLTSMTVITNGALLSRDFAETVREFSRYITSWGDVDRSVTVLVSKDRYHKGADSDATFAFYQRELAGAADVEFMMAGEKPLALGRGRTLEGTKIPPIAGSIPHKIETLEAGKHCGCRVQNSWPAPHGADKIVCCRLVLSARGDLTQYRSDNGEYTADDRRRDLVICNLSPRTRPENRDIDRSIEQYNKQFISCHDAEEQEAAMQTAEYARHPRKVLEDIRWAYQLMQSDAAAKAALLSQWPDLEEQFELFAGLLEIAECLPDERLAEIMKGSGNQFDLWTYGRSRADE